MSSADMEVYLSDGLGRGAHESVHIWGVKLFTWDMSNNIVIEIVLSRDEIGVHEVVNFYSLAMAPTAYDRSQFHSENSSQAQVTARAFFSTCA